MRGGKFTVDIPDLLFTSIQSGSPVRLIIQGNSMAPSLNQGEAVFVRGLAGRKLLLGDVIVVQIDGDLITHRIVARRGDDWYTKGDGSPKLDPPIRPEAVLGWVEAIEIDGEVTSTYCGRRKSLNSMIAWLAWKEGEIYRMLDRETVHPTQSIRWIGWLILLPMRVLVWCLAILWR